MGEDTMPKRLLEITFSELGHYLIGDDCTIMLDLAMHVLCIYEKLET